MAQTRPLERPKALQILLSRNSSTCSVFSFLSGQARAEVTKACSELLSGDLAVTRSEVSKRQRPQQGGEVREGAAEAGTVSGLARSQEQKSSEGTQCHGPLL